MKRWNRILAALLAAVMLCGALTAFAEMELELGMDPQESNAEIQLEIDPESVEGEMGDIAELPGALEIDGLGLDGLDTGITVDENILASGTEAEDTATIPSKSFIDGDDEYDAFDIDENGVLVRYYGDDGDVVIPDGVTSIGEYAFDGCDSLTSITIPDSVTSIGEGAFSDCYSLTSVTIPDSVTSIGEWAFGGCNRLEEINVTGDNRNYASKDGILYTHDMITLLQCPGAKTSVTIPNGVTSIGEYAFGECESLTSVTIPNSVTNIGEYAFYKCESLTSVTIPDSVTSIGEWAFGSCNRLEEINVTGDNRNYASKDGILYTHDMITLLQCPGAKTSVTIPNGVTSIGEYAFCECESLTSVTIPNSVTSIGCSAFYGCKSMANVTILAKSIDIDEDAFENSSPTFHIISGSNAIEWAENLNYDYDIIENGLSAESLQLKSEQTYRLKVLGGYEGSVTWSSSDNSIAAVDNGKVIAKKVGKCVISAKLNSSETLKCKVTVYDPAELNDTTLSLIIGDTYTLKVTGLLNRKVTWSSSNTAVATVDNGKITPKQAGNCVISAKLGKGKYLAAKTLTCKVTVKDVAAISDKTLSLQLGETHKLTITGLAKRTVTWSSSNDKVATVKNGKITPKQAGRCTITAAIENGKTLTCKVTVTDPAKLSKSTLSLRPGKSSTLTVTGLAGRTLIWSTSNAKVATVKDGKVTAVDIGKCSIIAKVGAKVLKCLVTVSCPTPHLYKHIKWKDYYTYWDDDEEEYIFDEDAYDDDVWFYNEYYSEEYDTFYDYLYAIHSKPLKSESIAAGTNLKLYASNLYGHKVYWSSSNNKIATVKDGNVTGLGFGKCTITAKVGNKTKLTCSLVVFDGAALSSENLTISTIDSAKIKLTGGLKRKVTWSTSDSNVVKITKSDNGCVSIKAVKTGKATITAKVKGGKTLKCIVTVVNPLTISEYKDDDLYYWQVGVKFTNHSNKKIIYATFDILQYNNKGDRLKSPYDYYYYNDDIAPHSSRYDSYTVNDDTRSVKFKIREVTFADKTTWRP